MFVQCASTKWFVHFVRLCLHQMGGGAMIYEPCHVCSMSQFLWLANGKRATDGSSALFFVFSFTLEVPLWMWAHLRFIFGAFDGDLVYGLDDGNGLWESWSMSSVICVLIYKLIYVLNEHCSYISSYVCSVSDCGRQMPLCVRLCALPPLWLRSACLVRY